MYVACFSMAEPRGFLRIGELSRRVGVSEHLLRIWERRYGLLEPARSAGGFRLYSDADIDRVQRMQAQLARGLSAAQAARVVLDEEATPSAEMELTRSDRLSDGVALAQALTDLDEAAAHAALDRLFAQFTVETVLRDVLMPYLHDLGERWQHGAVSVAQEHFASNVLRGRLASLARGWGLGHGPLALLACAPQELHDLPLLMFGIVLHRNGWRVGYLGMSTPLDDLLRCATELQPDLVVITATTPERLEGLADDLSAIARVAPLGIAGAGATEDVAKRTGARLLTGDPVTEAQRL
jgi:MerR family transcriptional regulator, light-induced transcriptional regulator